MNSPMATDQRGLWSNRQLIFQLEDKVNPACNGSAWESVPASRYAKIGPCSSQQVGSVTANAAGSKDGIAPGLSANLKIAPLPMHGIAILGTNLLQKQLFSDLGRRRVV